MRCPNCNTENSEGSKFCKGCGHSLSTEPQRRRNAGSNTIKPPEPNKSLVVRLAQRLTRLIPFRGRIQQHLEVEQLARINPIIILASMAATLLIGGMTSTHGHIETHPFLFQVMPIISSYNPALGFLSALTFAVGDFAQKLVINDVYHPGTLTQLDYWGARIGYLIAYNAVTVFGVLPGVLGRIFRKAVQNRITKNTDGGSLSAGGRVASTLAFAAGAAVGSAISGASATILEIPAFYMRPTPDVSCANLMISNNINNSIPNAATAGAVGGGATTLVQPQPETETPPETEPETRDEEKPEEQEETREEQEETQEEVTYRIVLQASKTQLKGDGLDSSTITAEIRGSDGSVVDGVLTFEAAPYDAGTLQPSAGQAIFQTNFLMENSVVTISCQGSARILISDGGYASVPLPNAQIVLNVTGASPRLELTASPQGLKGDGESTSVIRAALYVFGEETPPENIVFYAVDCDPACLHGQADSTINFTPEFEWYDTINTIKAVATISVGPLGTMNLEDTVPVEIIGAEPELTLTASPDTVMGDGKQSTTIKGTCVVFDEQVDAEIQFQASQYGEVNTGDKDTATFTPYYTAADTQVTISACATLEIQSVVEGLFLEASTVVNVRGAEITLKITPKEIRGDEIDEATIRVEPEEIERSGKVSLEADPFDQGVLSSDSAPSKFRGYLTETDSTITIRAQVDQEQGDPLEKTAEIEVIGADPRLELEPSNVEIRGDGKTELRLRNKITLFGQQVSEEYLDKLDTEVEWIEENQEETGEFTDHHKTWVTFKPFFRLRDAETKIKAKITIRSKETDTVITEESQPVTVVILGALPRLQMNADPGETPGDGEHGTVVKAKLLVFNKEKTPPEGAQVEFTLPGDSGELGRIEETRPMEAEIVAEFVAVDRETGQNSQTATVEGKMDLSEDQLVALSPDLTGHSVGDVTLEGETSFKVTGCTVKLTSPPEAEQYLAKDKELFRIKAKVSSSRSEPVPGVEVRITYNDKTRGSEETREETATTDENGVIDVPFIYSGADQCEGGSLEITAEINGALKTRHWDKRTVHIRPLEDFIRLELIPTPPTIPGAEKVSPDKIIQSEIEARLIVMGEAVPSIPEGSKVEFQLVDIGPELGELEELSAAKAAFKPEFLARDMLTDTNEQEAKIKATLEITKQQLQEISSRLAEQVEEDTIEVKGENSVKVQGCILKADAPEDLEQFLAKNGEIFKLAAKVLTPASEAVPDIEVKAVFRDKTKADHPETEESAATDEEGKVEIPYIFRDAAHSENGVVEIRTSIEGAHGSEDYDIRDAKIIAEITLTITAKTSRVHGTAPEVTSKLEGYMQRRNIRVKVSKDE